MAKYTHYYRVAPPAGADDLATDLVTYFDRKLWQQVPKPLRLKRIMEIVCEISGLQESQIRGKRLVNNLCFAQWAFLSAAYIYAGAEDEIDLWMGCRWSTVQYSVNMVKLRIQIERADCRNFCLAVFARCEKEAGHPVRHYAEEQKLNELLQEHRETATRCMREAETFHAKVAALVSRAKQQTNHLAPVEYEELLNLAFDPGTADALATQYQDVLITSREQAAKVGIPASAFTFWQDLLTGKITLGE